MRVLVIGSGGREHALCWAIAASPLLTKLWCAPGNPGIARGRGMRADRRAWISPRWWPSRRTTRSTWSFPVPRRRWSPASPMRWRRPRSPASAHRAPPPSSRAARAFTKELCDAAGIPTAQWERFDDADAARAFVRRRGAPVVVKADGLAAGKGVVVAATEDAALAAIDAMMARARIRRRRRRGGDRGMPGRRGGLAVRAVRRRDRVAARRRAGPQARRRRRDRAEHRRHGRLFADPDRSPGAAGGGDGRHHPSRARRNGAPRHAVPRHPVRRPDAHRRRRRS